MYSKLINEKSVYVFSVHYWVDVFPYKTLNIIKYERLHNGTQWCVSFRCKRPRVRKLAAARISLSIFDRIYPTTLTPSTNYRQGALCIEKFSLVAIFGGVEDLMLWCMHFVDIVLNLWSPSEVLTFYIFFSHDFYIVLYFAFEFSVNRRMSNFYFNGTLCFLKYARLYITLILRMLLL